MVQSIGMGKIKLMHEYAHPYNNDDSSDIECRLILCIGGKEDVPPNDEKHHHAMLALREHGTFTKANQCNTKDQLSEMERTCQKDKVIFFLDKA